MRLLLAAFLVVGILAACGDTDDDAPATPSPRGALEVGDRGETGNVAVTVVHASELDPSNDYVPEARHRFIGVDVIVENLTDEELNISALQQMTLRDDATSREFNPDMAATNLALADQNGTPTLEGTIPGQEEIRGPVGFQVPEDATDIVFLFESNVPEQPNEPLRFDLDV